MKSHYSIMAMLSWSILAFSQTPVLHLSFDEGNLSDSSPSNLGVIGSATFANEGDRNYASFDGTSNSLTVPLTQTFPNGLTLSAWVRAKDGTNGLPKNTALFWAHQDGSDGTVIAPGYNDVDKQFFRVGHNSGTFDEVTTGSELTNYLNTWVHWTVVKNPTAGTITLYKNGAQIAQSTGKTIVPEFEDHWSTSGLKIGVFWGIYFKGDLDEVQVFDTALTAQQVVTLAGDNGGNQPLPVDPRIRILPLGDSITYGLSFGQPHDQTAFPFGYRGQLQNLLQKRLKFVNDFEFIGSQSKSWAATRFNPDQATDQIARYDGDHEGRSSYTAARTFGTSPGNLLSVLTTSYTEESFNPHIVLLHVGINDLVAQNATAEELQTDYRTLVSKIYEWEPGVELYVSTLMCNWPGSAAYPELLAFNTWLKDEEVPHWTGQGKSITLVDMFAALEADGYSDTLPSTNPNYGSTESPNDRVHPNATGYAAMAAAWNAALTAPASIPARQLSYAYWADAIYSDRPGGSAHPDAAVDALPEGSTVPNLEFYIHGGSPGDAQAPPAPYIEIQSGVPVLIFQRRLNAGYSLSFEHSTSLTDPSWSELYLNTPQTNPNPDGETETVSQSSTLPVTTTPLQFFSFTVTLPE